MAKQLSGKITSTSMKNTVVVEIERKFRHPTYQKVVMRHKKYKAHVVTDGYKVGDIVTIIQTRPISRDKHFLVLENEKTTKVKENVKIKKINNK